jgi:hypothetical protein
MWKNDLQVLVDEDDAKKAFRNFADGFAMGSKAYVADDKLSVEDLELMAVASARDLPLARDNYPTTIKDFNSWESATVEQRAVALNLEVFEEKQEGRSGEAMGRGLKLGSEHPGVKEGDRITFVYGKWRVQHPESTNNEIDRDNWPIPNRALRNIVLDCTDSVAGIINDVKGTDQKINVKAVCMIKNTTALHEVKQLLKDDPDTLLSIIATRCSPSSLQEMYYSSTTANRTGIRSTTNGLMTTSMRKGAA